MIISKLISGLGNQLFQYTIARELSLRKSTNLKLDISFFETQDLRSYKLENFNIRSELATINEIKKLTWAHRSRSLQAKFLRHLEIILGFKRNYFPEKEGWKFDQEIYKISKETYIDGYWQHYKYYENLNEKIFSELTLKKHLLANIQKPLHEISNCESVSVHVRRGDYINDPEANKLMGVLPIIYYKNAIGLISDKFPESKFFFFSDDIKWVKHQFAGLKNVCFIEGYKDFEDLTLMSHCKHNIIANSSFSWWGAFLNNNYDKLVIAPKNWVADPGINQKVEIQLPRWIKL